MSFQKRLTTSTFTKNKTAIVTIIPTSIGSTPEFDVEPYLITSNMNPIPRMVATAIMSSVVRKYRRLAFVLNATLLGMSVFASKRSSIDATICSALDFWLIIRCPLGF